MSNTNINGGPAFPCDQIIARDANGHMQGVEVSGPGMTLRDYFATHEPLDPNNSIGKALAEKLIGRRLPEKEDGFKDQYELALAVAIFWAGAEAAYRYLRADAMLRAREGGAT